MDDALRSLIYRTFKIGRLSFTFLEALLAVCITGVGVMLRMSVMEYFEMTSIKLIGMVLDYVMAFMAGIYVYSQTGRKTRSLMTYALFVIWPIFIANSALMGLACVIAGILMIAGLLLFDRGYRKIAIVSFLAAAVAMVGTVRVPAAKDLLTYGWPNVYELTGKFMFVTYYEKVSLLFLMGILLCIGYVFKSRGYHLREDNVLPMMLMLSMLLPYFLPYMPAWAGYTADVLILLYAILRPKRCPAAFLHIISSYAAYAYVLNKETKLPMPFYALILLILLLFIGKDVYDSCS